jgi:ribosomal protein S18 acetylase RimI-like enzyme
MSARLRPMRDDELPSYLERLLESYADDISRNGGMTPETARRKAEADVERLFPAGTAPGMELRVVEDEAGNVVGHLVYAEREQHGSRYVFLYDIEIDEAHRGRGLGRAALLRLEDEVRARGLDRIELNVFGGNEAARNLYRSLGFEESSVLMGKNLS